MTRCTAPLASFIVAIITSAGCMTDESSDLEPELGETTQGVTVSSSTLMNGVWGWGANTTGGINGTRYVVTRNDDPVPAVAGTLRYGVENLSGARWIVFDTTVFPPNTKKSIYLTKRLDVESNTTIDGRGSYVSIRKYAYKAGSTWSLPGSDTSPCNNTSVCECDSAGPGTYAGPMMMLTSVKDVIISHLDFQFAYVAGTVPAAVSYDKQCFGDAIWIANSTGTQGTAYYDDIVINANDFHDCGDECIGVTRPTTNSALPRAEIQISRNTFISSSDPFLAMYKGILLGGFGQPGLIKIAASVFGNRFVGVKERQPRVEGAVAHIYNNTLEDWKHSAIASRDDTAVFAEQNVFRAITRTDQAWLFSGISNALFCVRDSVFSTTAISGVPASTTFPACGSADYPCAHTTSDKMQQISGQSYVDAIAATRALAGWRNVTNDVCPNPCH